MADDSENAKRVMWAVGGKTSKNIIHAYINPEAYEAGNCLCGRHVNPNIQIYDINLDDKSISDLICPDCRKRLSLLNYMRKQ